MKKSTVQTDVAEESIAHSQLDQLRTILEKECTPRVKGTLSFSNQSKGEKIGIPPGGYSLQGSVTENWVNFAEKHHTETLQIVKDIILEKVPDAKVTVLFENINPAKYMRVYIF